MAVYREARTSFGQIHGFDSFELKMYNFIYQGIPKDPWTTEVNAIP